MREEFLNNYKKIKNRKRNKTDEKILIEGEELIKELAKLEENGSAKVKMPHDFKNKNIDSTEYSTKNSNQVEKMVKALNRARGL